MPSTTVVEPTVCEYVEQERPAELIAAIRAMFEMDDSVKTVGQEGKTTRKQQEGKDVKAAPPEGGVAPGVGVPDKKPTLVVESAPGNEERLADHVMMKDSDSGDVEAPPAEMVAVGVPAPDGAATSQMVDGEDKVPAPHQEAAEGGAVLDPSAATVDPSVLPTTMRLARSPQPYSRPGALHVYASGRDPLVVGNEEETLETAMQASPTMEPNQPVAHAYAVEEEEREEAPHIHAKVISTMFVVERKRFWQIMAIVMVLLLVVIGTTLGILEPRIANSSGTEMGLTGSSLSGEERAQRREVLVNTLAPLGGEQGALVFEPNGPQSSADRIAALEWLVEDIPANVTADRLLYHYPSWKMRQRYVMALLFFATDGANWYKPLNFLTPQGECNWFTIRTRKPDEWETAADLEAKQELKGLTCDGDGKVACIILWNNNLVGTLPPEIASLKESLLIINIPTNSLSSTIPSSLGELSELNMLFLSENCLSGTIPESLFQLENLKASNFHGNKALRGSLNGFCNGTSYRDGTLGFLSADCGDCPNADVLVECECCTCCDSSTFSCCDKKGAVVFDTYSSGSFNRGECTMTDKQRLWEEENCPCLDKNDKCTMDCPF